MNVVNKFLHKCFTFISFFYLTSWKIVQVISHFSYVSPIAILIKYLISNSTLPIHINFWNVNILNNHHLISLTNMKIKIFKVVTNFLTNISHLCHFFYLTLYKIVQVISPFSYVSPTYILIKYLISYSTLPIHINFWNVNILNNHHLISITNMKIKISKVVNKFLHKCFTLMSFFYVTFYKIIQVISHFSYVSPTSILIKYLISNSNLPTHINF